MVDWKGSLTAEFGYSVEVMLPVSLLKHLEEVVSCESIRCYGAKQPIQSLHDETNS